MPDDQIPPPPETPAAPRKPRNGRLQRKPNQPEQAAPAPSFVLPPDPRRPTPGRRRIMLYSALLVVGLPTLCAVVYYSFFASDQYAASGHFVVRHRAESPAALSTLSFLGLGSSGTGSTPDMLVVNDYMASLQMIKDLAPRVELRSMYATPTADWLARLKPPYGENTISDEDLRNYWLKMATVHFDQTTGLSTFEVRAFTAEDAKTIADAVFKLSEELVNRLSERAQEDALLLARREVEAYRQRALASLDAMLAFQEQAQQVDPQGFASARTEIQAGIEQELTQLQAQLDVLRKKLPEDAPGITQVKDRLGVIERQLIAERARSTVSSTGDSAAKILNEFAKLKLESEFATQAYMSSLASLESARLQAIRQNLYLETFVRPHLPQISEYPRALLNTLLVFVVSFLAWAIGGLLISAAREHA
jgi:capsular polysaccharide transport system permease protein